MAMQNNSIILIGMPGVGKSTLGQLLAKKHRWPFIDTDQLIEQQQGCALQNIVDKHGYLALRHIEEQCLLKLSVNTPSIIATGGSAIYSPHAMVQLATLGTIVFLDAGFASIEARIDNFTARGLAKQPGQDLNSLYNEREPLYKRYAELTINTDNKTVEATVTELQQALSLSH